MFKGRLALIMRYFNISFILFKNVTNTYKGAMILSTITKDRGE